MREGSASHLVGFTRLQLKSVMDFVQANISPLFGGDDDGSGEDNPIRQRFKRMRPSVDAVVPAEPVTGQLGSNARALLQFMNDMSGPSLKQTVVKTLAYNDALGRREEDDDD